MGKNVSLFSEDCGENLNVLCDGRDGSTVVCCQLVSKCDDRQLKALTCRCSGEARGPLAPAQSKQESASLSEQVCTTLPK